jgi:hypothetical protein
MHSSKAFQRVCVELLKYGSEAYLQAATAKLKYGTEIVTNSKQLAFSFVEYYL